MPAVTFTVETLSDTTEGGVAGTFRVTATGDPGDFTPYQVVAVWSGTGGTATYGTDYTASPGLAGYLYFPSSGSQATVTITPTDDSTYEGDETLELRIQRYQMFPTGPVFTGTMTIHDNEPPAVVSVARVADAVEGGADGTFRFTRTGGNLGQSLTVSYTVETTGTGAATPTTDYTAQSGTVTFAANAATADVTVDAGTDGLIEDVEWVSLSIDADSDYEVGWADGAVVFIRDQTREVSVAGVQDAEEGGADGILRFTRTGDLTETLTVTYTVATTGPSLATPTADYTALTGSVTFAAYSATADVSVVTADDGVQEPDEVVIVTITAASTYTIGTGTGQVWIADDDYDNDGGAMYWISDDAGYWDDPSNWSLNREPVPGDNLYFTGSHIGDMIGFGSTEPEGEDEYLSYASVHVIDDYTGTITLTLPVSLGTLELRSEDAVIDQPLGAESELTVTARFDWTGGTINESGTASTVNISGAVGEVEPLNEGTLTIGSTLNVVFGAAVEFSLGTLCFAQGDGLYVASARVRVNTYVKLDVSGNGSRLITLDSDSTYHVVRKDLGQTGLHVTQMAIVNNGGDLTIDSGIRMEIAARTAQNPGVSYLQTAGFLTITGGSTLVAPDDAVIAGGWIYAIINVSSTRVDIEGNLMVGGGVYITPQDSYAAQYRGKLRVVGNIDWYDGSYLTSFDSRWLFDCYTWEATGSFTIGDSARMLAQKRDVGQPADLYHWSLLEAQEFNGPMLYNPNNLIADVQPTYATTPAYSMLGPAIGSWYLRKNPA